MSDPVPQSAGPVADLQNPDPGVRRQALLTLAGAKRDRALLDLFLGVAQQDPEPRLRLLARQLYQETKKTLGDGALGQSLIDVSTGEFDTQSLEKILDSGETSAKLEAIAQAAKAENPKAIAVFRARIANEGDPWVIASLLKGIGQLGDSSDIHVIQPFLKHDDLRIQANAIEALELIGDELSFSLVAPMLQSSDPRIRANSIKCLIRFDPEEAIDTLARMADSNQVAGRESAVYCMGIVDHPRIPGIVASMVARETEEELLQKQLNILGEEGGRESLGPLAALRDTLGGELQTLAAMALGRVRGRVEVTDDEITQAKLDFETEHLKGAKTRRGALAALPGDDEEVSASGIQKMRGVTEELDSYRRKKKKAIREADEEKSGLQEVAVFFNENKGFGGLVALTSFFLVSSAFIFMSSSGAPPEPTRKATRSAIKRPIKKKPTKKKPRKVKPNQTVTLEAKVNNIDRKRKTALLKHEGKVLSVKFRDTPSELIKRNHVVEVRGHFTGKTRFGAKEFIATEIRKR